MSVQRRRAPPALVPRAKANRDSLGVVAGTLLDQDTHQPIPYEHMSILGARRITLHEDTSRSFPPHSPTAAHLSTCVRGKLATRLENDDRTRLSITNNGGDTASTAPSANARARRHRRTPFEGLLAHGDTGFDRRSWPGRRSSGRSPRMSIDSASSRTSLNFRIRGPVDAGAPVRSWRRRYPIIYTSPTSPTATAIPRFGGTVYVDSDAVGRAQSAHGAPDIGELGDPAFLSTHCFEYGGTETVGAPHGLQALDRFSSGQ